MLVSGGVRRLVGAPFEFRDLGVQQVKGWPEPMAVSQVLRPRCDVSRIEALGAAPPLIRREVPLRGSSASAAGDSGGLTFVNMLLGGTAARRNAGRRPV